jgi:hypothetical protein
MRNYWLKIAASALGIFAVGMLVITGFRSVKGKVTQTINSTDPIPIPVIGLVPFKVNSDRLGSISRVEFLRSDPEHVSGVRVLVKLADSVTPDRLAQCQLALDDVDNIGDRTTFRCEPATGPVSGLEQFGTLVIKNSSDSFPLLLPAKAVSDLRATQIHISRHGIEVHGPKDTLREALMAHTDSVREQLESLVEARGDSVDNLRDAAEELEDSASNAPVGQRRQLQRGADSVRSQMRAMVDRLKADEARLSALEEVSGLSPAERDSLANLGATIRDSVHRVVARELQKAQAEIQRAQRAAQTGAPAVNVGEPAVKVGDPAVKVEAPAPPKPPARPK